MNKKVIILLSSFMLLSTDIHAQAGEGMYTLRSHLYQAYASVYPYFSILAGGLSLVAGIAALLYVFVRTYKMLMLAEPFDVYPILKPFGIGLLLMFYPGLISLMNAIGDLPVNYTNALVGETNETIEVLLNQKLQETQAWKWYNSGGDGWTGGDYGAWVEDNEIDTGPLGLSIPAFMNFAGEQAMFQIKTSIKEFLFTCMTLLYYGCSLLIDLARMFFLLVLGLLGPLAIAFSMFDVFSGSLTGWITRYAHVYLWLPIANIYGFLINQIQINIIQESIVQIQADGSSVFDSTDMAMLVFLFFAAMGYFTIPTVASWIISPGHGGMGRAMSSVNALPNTISAAGGALSGVVVAGVAGAVGGAVASNAGGKTSANHHQHSQLTQ